MARAERTVRTGEAAGPPETIRCRQRQLVRRMMHRMVAPEPARAMRRAMKPVVAELLTDEAGDPPAPLVHRHGPEPVMPDPVHCIAIEGQRQQPAQRIFADQEVSHRHRRGAPVVTVPAASNGEHHGFGQRRHEHHRNTVFEDRQQHVHARILRIGMRASVDRQASYRKSKVIRQTLATRTRQNCAALASDDPRSKPDAWDGSAIRKRRGLARDARRRHLLSKARRAA